MAKNAKIQNAISQNKLSSTYTSEQMRDMRRDTYIMSKSNGKSNLNKTLTNLDRRNQSVIEPSDV